MRGQPGSGPFNAVAVGGSSGSLAALLDILPRLTGDFPWPVLAVVHLHPRQKGGFVDLLEGDVNWPEVMKALKDVGYDGYLTAEMIPTYRFYPEVRLVNTSTAMDAMMTKKLQKLT